MVRSKATVRRFPTVERRRGGIKSLKIKEILSQQKNQYLKKKQ